MVSILFFIISFSSSLNFPADNVIETTKKVLQDLGIPVYRVTDGTLTTETITLHIDSLSNYIIEDQFDENPGWTRARFWLKIKISGTDKDETQLEIFAHFQRFGVPSALLLIPPAWTDIESNGRLEKEIFSTIERKLNSRRK